MATTPTAPIYPQGNEEEFNALGQMTDRIDTQGNVTHYAYNAAGNPSTVTDPLCLATTYGYNTDGLCTSIEDFAGRTTRMTFTEDTSTPVTEHLLTTLTEPNPDGSGSGRSRVAIRLLPAYRAYDQLDNPVGAATHYEYRGDRLVKRIYPDNTFETMTPPELVGVVDPAQYGDPGDLAPVTFTSNVKGTRTDQRGYTTTDTTDVFGNITSETNALGQVTTYQRDPNGLVSSLRTCPTRTASR